MQPGEHWATTFGNSMTDISALLTSVRHQTIRQTIPIAFGGNAIRLTLSNRFGIAPITIDTAYISVSDEYGRPLREKTGKLAFSTEASIDLPLGEDTTSDALNLLIPDQATLIVDLYISGAATITTGTIAIPVHVALSDEGNHCATPGEAFNHQQALMIDGANLPSPMLLISRVDVLTDTENCVFAAFGDSITQMGTWSRHLTERLQESNLKNWSIVNASISGNRILHDSADGPMMGLFGPAAVKRFSVDVLNLSGLASVSIFLGINDLTHPGLIAPPSETVTPEAMIAGLTSLAKQARDSGIRVFGCTILPFGNHGDIPFGNELKRRQINDWIRQSPVFDALFDFDRAVADPSSPTSLLPACDSGDHLHPSDAGGKTMAEAIDLNLFRA